MEKELANRAAGGLVGPARGLVGKNPAASRLLDALEQYAEVKAEHLIRSAGSRLTGVLDGNGAKAVAEGALGGDGVKGAAGKAVAGAVGAMAGKNKGGKGGSKSTLIKHDVDVAVPVNVAYDQWTQLDSFGEFMKSIEGVEKQDEVESTWRVKIGPSRRTWKARITEQVPDRRIQWTSEGAKGSVKGTITFHPLCDDLTRVGLVMEYFPQGPVEKVANWLHLPSANSRWDLQHFRRFITEKAEAEGGWRGEIRDGEVVQEGQEEDQEEGQEDAPEAREEEAPARRQKGGNGRS